MINLLQLLELVVNKPDRCNVDMRFMTAIWDACIRWCQQQFSEMVGVRFLGLGELCFRRDVIGEMEFLNPMFIMSESFARSHGLHDRRPKTHAAEVEIVNLDMVQIAQLTTDLLGEVVGRDVVDSALRDVVDRIGEVCADEKRGIVMLDFGFGKLVSENKSVEFVYGDGKPPKTGKSAVGKASSAIAMARPTTSHSYTSNNGGTGVPELSLGLDGSGVPGMQTARKAPEVAVGRAPLQRPRVRYYKTAEKVTKADLLRSHEQQLDFKDMQIAEQREREAQDHIDSLQRLRGEMLVDFDLRGSRQNEHRALASQLQEQRREKLERDLRNAQKVGINHWPFRTEEEVQASVAAVNRRQKAELDLQMQQKLENRAFLESVAQKQTLAEDQAAVRQAELAKEEALQRKRSMAQHANSMDRTMDDAFKRYEQYLSNRKAAVDHSKSFMREQMHLTEQAELLKQEETRRRMEHMKRYLDAQVGDKKARAEVERLASLRERHFNDPTTLPAGIEPDNEDEQHYVKQALKHALDEQVEEKRKMGQTLKLEDLEEQRRALNCIAREMQQTKFRELELRRDRTQMLNAAWAKQEHLKKLERALEKDTYL